ncbi:MAG: HD domain-containing phosphohydrolase [Acidobacteriota bacterium]
MSTDLRRIHTAEEVLKRLAGAVKGIVLYGMGHPILDRALEQLLESMDRIHAEGEALIVGILEGQVIVNDVPMPKSVGAAEAIERLRAADVERITIEKGVTREELLAFLASLVSAAARRNPGDAAAPINTGPHTRVGRLQLQRRVQSEVGSNVHEARQLYDNAVGQAEQLWYQSAAEGSVDPALAKTVVEGLAQAVGQNRRAMVALTALCRYDNYTFTHMVNVSVLTIAQAQSLGIEGAALRQFGLAGLMHDIGKIKTPAEVLKKTSKLTDDEFTIMKRHPVDGAEILRRQLEMPPLAAVVAFEHHLRVDGTGYPTGVSRTALNVATQLCSIADVYDAMRSQRAYQEAFPTDRILTVLQQADNQRFDQRLVRRFAQLMGIYPPGSLVRLDTGSIAVVVRTHAPDPARPAVRVLTEPDGRRLEQPFDVALWEDDGPAGPPPQIVTPLDPAVVGIDPLPYLEVAAA